MRQTLRPAYKSPLPAPPPPPSWTGCYVEGGGGYGLWNIDHFGEVSGTTVTSTTTSGGRGWLGTVGGGCDYQFSPGSGWGNWVVGAFADYDFMDLHRNFEGSFGPFAGEEKDIVSLGCRRPDWLPGHSECNGGYSQTRFDQVNFSFTFSPFTPVAVMGAHDYNGWFLGGGTEISLSGLFGLPLPAGLFWRSEYRFASYNNATLPILTTAGAPTTLSEHTQPYVQTITTALVYRFNWYGH